MKLPNVPVRLDGCWHAFGTPYAMKCKKCHGKKSINPNIEVWLSLTDEEKEKALKKFYEVILQKPKGNIKISSSKTNDIK